MPNKNYKNCLHRWSTFRPRNSSIRAVSFISLAHIPPPGRDVKYGVDPALTLLMISRLIEVEVSVGWILVTDLQHPPDEGFVPFPAGIVKLPVPPDIPGPRIMVPLVAGGVLRIAVIGLQQMECQDVRGDALFMGPW